MNNSFTELLINQALENRDFDLIKRIQSGEYFNGKENIELVPFSIVNNSDPSIVVMKNEKEKICKAHLTDIQIQEIKDDVLTMYITEEGNKRDYTFISNGSQFEDNKTYEIATIGHLNGFLSKGKIIKKPIRVEDSIVQCFCKETEHIYEYGWETVITFGDTVKEFRGGNDTYPVPIDESL